MKTNIISFCVNLEDNIFLRKKIINSINTIWLNSYKSELAFKTNIIIPIESDFEQKGSFINLEGRTQQSLKIFKNASAVNINDIIHSIFENKKISLLDKHKFLEPKFETIRNSYLFDSLKFFFIKKIPSNYFFKNSSFYNYSFKSLNEDFYLSNNFTKNSNTMSQCSRHLRKNSTNF
jgi:NADH dehydrogenase/NADH:ubiquinone oxidoreductase subunit G